MYDDRPVHTHKARSKPASLKLTAVSNHLPEKSLFKLKYNNSSSVSKGVGSFGLCFDPIPKATYITLANVFISCISQIPKILGV